MMKTIIYLNLFLVVCIMLLFIVSCSERINKVYNPKKLTKAEQEDTARENLVFSCQSQWKYKELTESITNVEVLLFNQKRTLKMFYPNLLICKTNANDTIGFLDQDFKDTLLVGDKINLAVRHWTNDDKEYKRHMITVFKEVEKNRLYCAVKTVYWGKITR